jgi:hypothetical protein
VCVLAVRLRVVAGPFAAAFWYRIGVAGTVMASYFLLKGLLPIVNTETVDQTLYELDLALFGFEPAMALEAWVTPVTTEWFSFFYFSYFLLLSLHIWPVLILCRQQQLMGEFCLGMLGMFCVGHVLYMLVPGYGPVTAFANEFAAPLPSGLWFDMVNGTVSAAGAQMDIFPSIHTAIPTFLTLVSYRHRNKLPFRYTWPVLAFFSANIIIATMFLRWHYVIDVVAGLVLGGASLWGSRWVTHYELARRKREHLTANWPRFFPKSPARDSTPSTRPGELEAA